MKKILNRTETLKVKKVLKDKNKLNKKPNMGTYLAKYKWWITLYIFLMIIACVGDIFFTIMLANVIVQITISNFSKAILLLLGVVGVSVIQRICWYCSNLIYYKYSNKFMTDLSTDLAKQAFKLNSKTYNDHDTGTFVQRIVEDPAQIIDNLSNIVDMVMELITALIMLIYIITLSPWIALILVGLAIIAGIIEFFRVKIRRKNRWIVRCKNDKVHSLTTEIVHSEKDIKSLGLEDKLSQVSKEKYEDYRNERYKMDKTDCNFWSIRNFIIGIGALLTLVFGVWLMDKGLLTLASFMIVYSNKDALFRVVYNSGNLANVFVGIKVCHNRMFSLFDEYEFVTERFGKLSLENVKGEVEFKNVSYTFKEFEYKEPSNSKGQSSEKKKSNKKKRNKWKREKLLVNENKIFDNLSFKIQPNTTVAFVGKSGSGKSTILNLMSKMYEADEGQVLIDGVDIKDLTKETLRKTISLVNQFPYIFDMTIKENLLLAKSDATDQEIDEAIKKASLKDFIDSLPKGIDTCVGESGIKLSGGQRQRLAIARALLRNSPIIIFDESTSSLDNFAQGEIKKSIDGLKGQSTIVIVAHRLSTIKDVDKIFFLDEGEIIDEGTFDYLFEHNEKFKTMFLAENI